MGPCSAYGSDMCYAHVSHGEAAVDADWFTGEVRMEKRYDARMPGSSTTHDVLLLLLPPLLLSLLPLLPCWAARRQAGPAAVWR